jgi:uncharacterized C2H2 Zn-finger protein
MKGPSGRIKLDVRRFWKCPTCGTVIKMDGDVAQKICKCQKEGVWMKIVEEPDQKRVMASIQTLKDKEIKAIIVSTDDTVEES